MNDHVITLEHARDKLINRRRSLAVALLQKPEEVEQFIRIQNAVAAVEQALSLSSPWPLTATNTYGRFTNSNTLAILAAIRRASSRVIGERLAL